MVAFLTCSVELVAAAVLVQVVPVLAPALGLEGRVVE